jgi:hypothetical protein
MWGNSRTFIALHALTGLGSKSGASIEAIRHYFASIEAPILSSNESGNLSNQPKHVSSIEAIGYRIASIEAKEIHHAIFHRSNSWSDCLEVIGARQHG